MRTDFQPATYMTCNRKGGVIYTGVTSNLLARAWQHKKSLGGFTTRYNCDKLVWFELFGTMELAITREKQIKGGSRGKKVALIEAINPDWKDLYGSLLG